ncbi:hypothetical protein NC653_004971 [Populus alba x Populus x berolinensis]|uniref:Uncharacterized protein n=1 Tax=Populus alba x Populus x berolinensis TaxID=444605 RepID=A0AAD6WAH5_9ROSI|nr:hypothetical protein NC653_004971 [Populus alba x Populus x berolinensis]
MTTKENLVKQHAKVAGRSCLGFGKRLRLTALALKNPSRNSYTLKAPLLKIGHHIWMVLSKKCIAADTKSKRKNM